MAIVAGAKSTLNPDAPLFIPVAFRLVEDFSPEWWELVKTSSWFRDFWLSEHPEESFTAEDGGDDGGDIVDFLSESFELRLDDHDEYFFDEGDQYEESAPDFGNPEKPESGSGTAAKIERKHPNDLEIDSKTLLKNLNLEISPNPKKRSPKSAARSPKFMEKPAKHISPKCSPRLIQQPR